VAVVKIHRGMVDTITIGIIYVLMDVSSRCEFDPKFELLGVTAIICV